MISIVIVSMSKLDNLRYCLPSIKKYTKCEYEVYVVAYLYSQENLGTLRKEFPWIKVIESNEIRGFSENNNLALRQIKSEYVFIQNDDTEYKEPVLDKLLSSIKKTPNAAIMSPILFLGNGDVQYNGRREYTYLAFLLNKFDINIYSKKSKYENGNGIYKSYNISGAAFLIKTEIFRKVGFFDEKYFFCPEDVALSTKLNRKGFSCYVDADASITHYYGASSKKSRLFYATTITAYVGDSYFFADSNIKLSLIKLGYYYKLLAHSVLYRMKHKQHNSDYKYIYKMTLQALNKRKSCKEVFLNEYEKILKK